MSRGMPNLAKFKKGLLEVANKKVPDRVKEVQSDLAGHVYSGVVLRTPVLTGHARHNWMPTLKNPWLQEIEGVFGGDTTGDPFTATEIVKMKRIQRELKDLPVGQTVWIANSVPYIERLENGWSNKSPEGMAEVTVNSILEDVNMGLKQVDEE